MQIKKLYMIIAITSFLVISCSKTSKDNSDVWAEIDKDTETTIEVWAWNVAASHLQATVESFNKKYPKIKVNVTEFGGNAALKQKLFIALGANSDLPNLIQIEDVDVPLITENYHEFILDLKDKMPNNWSNIVAPSKISTSFDSMGKQVVMPFGIGIGVLFYREDLFKKAGINIEDIVTWEDYINAGKKLQSVLPNTKMIGMPYPQGFSAFIRAVMLQQNKDYFTKDGKIAIASKEAIEAGKLIQRLVLEGIAFDTTDWTGTIRACKTDDIASIPYGIWWGGTLKDQAPEMKGKWKVTYLPILKQGDIKTSIWGGASGAVVNVGDAVKQTAAVEFAKNAMLTVENQMLAYKSYGLIPTYLPTFDEDEFYEEDPYFGKGFNELVPELIRMMPLAAKYTEIFPDTQTYMESAYQAIVNEKADPEQILKYTAQQLKNSTGVDIAE